MNGDPPPRGRNEQTERKTGRKKGGGGGGGGGGKGKKKKKKKINVTALKLSASPLFFIITRQNVCTAVSTAPHKFLGDQINSYGQLVSFTFTSETPDLLSKRVYRSVAKR
ncbi:hypothetical protein CRUP_010464 [Coryphaenoides rupestris]|nr:hypothetical protein CRUP_010464 [Coryphaenoides rupestris]